MHDGTNIVHPQDDEDSSQVILDSHVEPPQPDLAQQESHPDSPQAAGPDTMDDGASAPGVQVLPPPDVRRSGRTRRGRRVLSPVMRGKHHEEVVLP